MRNGGRSAPKSRPDRVLQGAVESALSRQQLRANELTSYYLVDLLCRFMRPDSASRSATTPDEPLALRLGRALDSGGPGAAGPPAQSRRFLAVHVRFLFRQPPPPGRGRGLLRVDGGVRLRVAQPPRRGRLRRGLLRARPEIRPVHGRPVGHQRAHPASQSSDDVLRLYEKWLRTGSPRDGQRLADQGILPNASIGSKFPPITALDSSSFLDGGIEPNRPHPASKPPTRRGNGLATTPGNSAKLQGFITGKSIA